MLSPALWVTIVCWFYFFFSLYCLTTLLRQIYQAFFSRTRVCMWCWYLSGILLTYSLNVNVSIKFSSFWVRSFTGLPFSFYYYVILFFITPRFWKVTSLKSVIFPIDILYCIAGRSGRERPWGKIYSFEGLFFFLSLHLFNSSGSTEDILHFPIFSLPVSLHMLLESMSFHSITCRPGIYIIIFLFTSLHIRKSEWDLRTKQERHDPSPFQLEYSAVDNTGNLSRSHHSCKRMSSTTLGILVFIDCADACFYLNNCIFWYFLMCLQNVKFSYNVGILLALLIVTHLD